MHRAGAGSRNPVKRHTELEDNNRQKLLWDDHWKLSNLHNDLNFQFDLCATTEAAQNCGKPQITESARKRASDILTS